MSVELKNNEKDFKKLCLLWDKRLKAKNLKTGINILIDIARRKQIHILLHVSDCNARLYMQTILKYALQITDKDSLQIILIEPVLNNYLRVITNVNMEDRATDCEKNGDNANIWRDDLNLVSSVLLHATKCDCEEVLVSHAEIIFSPVILRNMLTPFSKSDFNVIFSEENSAVIGRADNLNCIITAIDSLIVERFTNFSRLDNLPRREELTEGMAKIVNYLLRFEHKQIALLLKSDKKSDRLKSAAFIRTLITLVNAYPDTVFQGVEKKNVKNITGEAMRDIYLKFLGKDHKKAVTKKLNEYGGDGFCNWLHRIFSSPAKEQKKLMNSRLGINREPVNNALTPALIEDESSTDERKKYKTYSDTYLVSNVRAFLKFSDKAQKKYANLFCKESYQFRKNYAESVQELAAIKKGAFSNKIKLAITEKIITKIVGRVTSNNEVISGVKKVLKKIAKRRIEKLKHRINECEEYLKTYGHNLLSGEKQKIEGQVEELNKQFKNLTGGSATVKIVKTVAKQAVKEYIKTHNVQFFQKNLVKHNDNKHVSTVVKKSKGVVKGAVRAKGTAVVSLATVSTVPYLLKTREKLREIDFEPIISNELGYGNSKTTISLERNTFFKK